MKTTNTMRTRKTRKTSNRKTTPTGTISGPNIHNAIYLFMF